jgi:hypothetical protein
MKPVTFDARAVFWTDQEFLETSAVRERVQAKLKSIGFSDPGMKDAYDQLQSVK